MISYDNLEPRLPQSCRHHLRSRWGTKPASSTALARPRSAMQKRDARSQVLITPSFDEMVVVRSWLGLPKSNHLYQMHHITPTLNKISCQHVASLTLGGTQYCCIQNASHQPSHYQFIHIKTSEYLATVFLYTQFRCSWPRYWKDLQTEIFQRMLYKLHFRKEYRCQDWSREHCVVKRPVVQIDHCVNSLSFKVSTCWGPQSLDVSQGCTSSTTVACLLYGTNMGTARAQEQTWTCRLHSNEASSGLFCGTKRIVGAFCQVARFGFVELLFWTWRFACQAQAQGFFSCNTISRPSKSLFPLVVGFCLWSLSFRRHAWNS